VLTSNWIRSALVASLAAIMGLQAGCSTLNLSTPQIFKRQTARRNPAPRLPKITSENAAQVQFAMARSLERKGHLAKAAEAYQRIIDEHDLTAAYHRLAIVRDQQGNFEASSDLFAEALDREPDNAELLCDIGYSAYLRGNNEESAEAYDAAIRLQPDLQRAHNNLALLHARQQQYQSAVKEFALASNSYGTAHLNLAYALAANGRVPLAKKHAQRALEIDGRSEKAKALVAELERIEARTLARDAFDRNRDTEELGHSQLAVATVTSAEAEDLLATEVTTVSQEVEQIQPLAVADSLLDSVERPSAEAMGTGEESSVRTASVYLGEPVFQRQGSITLRLRDADSEASPPTSEIRFLPPY
jgi:tetratricopeptide (TPR) repeat protein